MSYTLKMENKPGHMLEAFRQVGENLVCAYCATPRFLLQSYVPWQDGEQRPEQAGVYYCNVACYRDAERQEKTLDRESEILLG